MLAGAAYNSYSSVYTNFAQVSHQLDCLPAYSLIFEVCHIVLSREIANTGEQNGHLLRLGNILQDGHAPILLVCGQDEHDSSPDPPNECYV